MPIRNVAANRATVTRTLKTPTVVSRAAITRPPSDEWLSNAVIAAALEIWDPTQPSLMTVGGSPAGSGSLVGSLRGLRGIEPLVSASTARMTLDLTGLNSRPCLKNADSSAAQYYAADGLGATTFTNGKSWSVLGELYVPAVGSVPGQQTVFSLGNSAQANDFLLLYLSSSASAPRLTAQFRANATTILTITGGWLAPGLHYYGLTFDGTSLRLYIDGVDWGAADVSAIGSVTFNRVTIGANRRTTVTQYLTAGSKLGRWLVWNYTLTRAEMASATRAIRPRYNGWAIDLFQEVDRTGGHNAFGSVIWRGGGWVSTNRRATSHAAVDGVIVVRTSPDFITWTERATLATGSSLAEYRDQRLIPLPDGSLGLYTVRWEPTAAVTHRTWLFRSYDGGLTWDAGRQVGEDNFWKWGLGACPDGLLRSLEYNLKAGTPRLRQSRSRDGVNWVVEIPTVDDTTGASEAHFAIGRDGTRYTACRVDSGGLLRFGVDAPPYDALTLAATSTSFHAPELLMWPDGRLLMGARTQPVNRPAVGFLDKSSGEFSVGTYLPGATDTSYHRFCPVGGDIYTAWYGTLPDPNYPCQYVARLTPPD
jgi:hypothetical protein